MREIEDPYFIHKLNTDKSYDSVCSECFRTVTTQPDQELLLKPEIEHRCPQRL